MNPEHVQELWRIRFGRILELEEESFNFYQKLLKEKSAMLKETGLEPMIKQIMRDEAKHIHIANELLQIAEGEENEKKVPLQSGGIAASCKGRK